MRKVGLFVVMIGALALSFYGQVSAVSPLLGTQMSVVFALTNDIASLLALNEVMNADNSSIRRWSWVVLFIAGGTALGLNTYHALLSATLPKIAAIAVGAGPVILAWTLSHVVALAMAADRRAAEAPATSHQVVEPVRHQVAEPVHQAAPVHQVEATRSVAHQVAGHQVAGHQVAEHQPHQATSPAASHQVPAHQDPPANLAQPGDLQERARQLVEEAAASGQAMGRGRLARALGVPENQARQLLAGLAASSTSHQAEPASIPGLQVVRAS